MEEGKVLLEKAGLEGDFEGIGNLAIGYPAGEKREAPEINSEYIKWLN